MELLVATGNKGKLKEIKELLSDLGLTITSLADHEGLPQIIEDGKTFKDNALRKALTISRHTGKLVMGEDSGLEVKALEDRPGVYSARYAGPDADDAKNNAKLLEEMKGLPASQRQARYRCAAALACADEVIDVVEGDCSGLIAFELRGNNGFGYDPLFLVPEYDRTFGELDPNIKAGMSHRARALRKVKKLLQDYLKNDKY